MERRWAVFFACTRFAIELDPSSPPVDDDTGLTCRYLNERASERLNGYIHTNILRDNKKDKADGWIVPMDRERQREREEDCISGQLN